MILNLDKYVFLFRFRWRSILQKHLADLYIFFKVLQVKINITIPLYTLLLPVEVNCVIFILLFVKECFLFTITAFDSEGLKRYK